MMCEAHLGEGADVQGGAWHRAQRFLAGLRVCPQRSDQVVGGLDGAPQCGQVYRYIRHTRSTGTSDMHLQMHASTLSACIHMGQAWIHTGPALYISGPWHPSAQTCGSICFVP